MNIDLGGRTIFASTGGREVDPARPTVVFLHGAGMDHTVWSMQTRWFAHHDRNVLALDMPGHGRSAGPSLRSIPDMAGFVINLLDRLAIETATLVGHSMGALVALATAARAGDRIAGLALLGVAPLMPVHPDLLAAAERGEHSCIDLMVTWGLGKAAQIGAYDAPGLWLTAASMRLLERADPKALAGDLAACDAYKTALADAAMVTAPTLLLLGREDRMTPSTKGADLGKAMKSARVEILPRIGHLVMIEDPVATLAALRTIC